MRRLIVFIIDIYQILVSSILTTFFSFTTGSACRHSPSCSRYAKDAVEEFGVVRGLTLSLGRILRCRPGGTFGFDPNP